MLWPQIRLQRALHLLHGGITLVTRHPTPHLNMRCQGGGAQVGKRYQHSNHSDNTCHLQQQISIPVPSLQAGGAMALLLRNINVDIIRLIGRWRSDKIPCYLHIKVGPLIQDHTTTMVADWYYTLISLIDLLPAAFGAYLVCWGPPRWTYGRKVLLGIINST